MHHLRTAVALVGTVFLGGVVSGEEGPTSRPSIPEEATAAGDSEGQAESTTRQGRIVRRATPPGEAELAKDRAPSGDRSWEDNPRVGGGRGRLRYRIARAPSEFVETPDVVTLEDGTRLEAYFMEVYGDWLVFYVKETGQSWLKEQIPRAFVADIEFDAYLERDPVEPPVIRAARKQPVPKDDILSGVFSGTQGRYTDWTISFRSEIDKFRDHAEDATEYGALEVESRFDQASAKGRFAHKIHAEGYYFLYAPGTVNNEEWVLVLSDVIQREVDQSPNKGFFSERIPDETFILHFSPRKDTFWLEWANVGQFSWTPLVRVKFHRQETDSDEVGGRGSAPSYRSLELREGGSSEGETPRPAADRPWGPRPAPKLFRDDRRKTTVVQADPFDSPIRGDRRARASQVGDWGRASTFWTGGR